MDDISSRILKYVSVHSGLSGRQIASALGCTSREVNQVLYYVLGPEGGGPLVQDANKKWHLKSNASRPVSSKASEPVVPEDDDDISIFEYRKSGNYKDMSEHKEIYFPVPYDEDEEDRLGRLLDVLGKEELKVVVTSYCPRDTKAILLFLRNKARFVKDKRFTEVGSVILTCALYFSNEGSSVTDSLFEKAKTNLWQMARDVEGINSTFIGKVVKKIISLANELGFTVNTPIVPLPMPETKMVGNGHCKVPWDHVTFNNGSITIGSANAGTGKKKRQPFTFKDADSDKAMNNIKAYFYRVPMIEVQMSKGQVYKVFNKPDLTAHILPLITRTGKNVVRMDLDTLELMASRGQDGIEYDRTGTILCELRDRSPYFEWLANAQIDGYKPILFEERQTHTNGEKILKGFAFTVRDRGDRVTVVFENDDRKCCSLVFTISKRKYRQEIDSIRDFLRSAEVNKRERLSRNTFLPLANGDVIPYRRVAHSQLYTWKKEILP